MRRLFLLLLVVACVALGSALADDGVRAVQQALKRDGFYFGDTSGIYDSATSAAVTRYQIRHGLPISGKLDGPTAKALGVPAAKAEEAEAVATSGTWRQLRNGDMQFLKKLNAGEIPGPAKPPRPTGSPALRRKVAATPVSRTEPTQLDDNWERLRDYVGAFVLAGLDPKVGSELEFFAGNVEYFGEHNVDRRKIRRDLLRYDERWPDRKFWLAGELEIERAAGNGWKVTFPLRYELRNGRKHASGAVLKTLTLRKTGADDYEIVAVDEWKRR